MHLFDHLLLFFRGDAKKLAELRLVGLRAIRVVDSKPVDDVEVLLVANDA